MGRSSDQVQALYLMHREDGLYKIGISVDPHGRKATLQSQLKTFGFPQRVDLLGYAHTPVASRLEKWLHGKYRQYWSSGEWFSLPKTEAVEVLLLLRRIRDTSYNSTDKHP